MNFALNIDILSVGIAIAANIILGTIVFLGEKKNATGRLFLLQTLVLSIWSVLNYLTYQITDLTIALWIERAVLFFAVPNSIVFLFLMYNFPSPQWLMSKGKTFAILILSFVTMGLTLTPYIFSGVKVEPGIVTPQPIVQPGMVIFGIVAVLSIPVGIYFLIKKFIKAKDLERRQFKFLLVGVVIMFFCIVLFNFIFPTVFDSSRFIPLSAVFTFPFVIFTFYAIYKHRLFNIRDLATVLVAFALTVVTFLEIIFANSLQLVIFRSSVFILVLVFSIQLIRNMFNLEFANDRLKELDELKSEFVSLATHQIRAPLTTIKGYISLIQEGDYGPVSPEVNNTLKTVMDSTNNLVTIVGDFLDVSRIEQGRMKYDNSDFDIEQLAQEVVTEYKPNVEKKGLQLHYIFDQGKNYLIHADRGKMKQIIGNIIDNSIKYTPKGEIDVYVSGVGDKVRIKIADTGVGIAKETMPLLFQKFSRANDASKTNILGTGLGLYVAHNMIEAMGGKIWAESAGKEKGSQFYIEMPRTAPKQPAS